VWVCVLEWRPRRRRSAFHISTQCVSMIFNAL
jgi:hypothetical protein